MIIEIQENDMILFSLVKSFLHEKSDEKIKEIQKQIAELDPFLVKTVFFEGIILQEKGDFKGSLEKFANCITKSVVYKESGFGFLAQVESGYSQIKLYEYDTFLENFDQFFKKYPLNENIITLCLIAVNRMIDDNYFESDKIIDFYLDVSGLPVVYNLEFLLLKGIIGINKKNVFYSREFFSQALERIDEIDDEHLKCRIFANYGVFLEITGKESEAKKYYHNAKLLSQNIEHYNVEAEIEANLGIIRYNEKDYTSAIFHFKRTLKLYEKMKTIPKIARFNANIGYIYEKDGKINTARKYYKKAIEIFIDINDLIQAANIYNILGEMCVKNNEFQEATENFNIAMDIHSDPKIGNNMLKLIDYRNIARVYLKSEDYSKAIEVLKESYRLASELEQMQEKGKLLQLMGHINTLNGDYEKADKELNEAESIYSNFPNHSYNSDIYKSYAELYYKMEKFSKALKYAKLAYDLFNQAHRGNELSLITGLISDIYTKQNNFTLSHEYTDIAIKINQNIEEHERLYTNYMTKSELYKIEKDTKNSNIYKSMAYQLKRDRNFSNK